MKRNNGITLIALVITIIVLLILAGVSISLTLGNNGVLNQATNAVEANRDAKAKEEVEIAWAGATSDYWAEWAEDSNKSADAEFYEEKLTDYLSETGTAYVDDNGSGTYKVEYETNDQSIVYTFIMNGEGKATLESKAAPDPSIVYLADVAEIGDYIDLGFNGTSYTAGWRVLKVDKTGRRGEVLLISANTVLSYYCGDSLETDLNTLNNMNVIQFSNSGRGFRTNKLTGVTSGEVDLGSYFKSKSNLIDIDGKGIHTFSWMELIELYNYITGENINEPRSLKLSLNNMQSKASENGKTWNNKWNTSLWGSDDHLGGRKTKHGNYGLGGTYQDSDGPAYMSYGWGNTERKIRIVITLKKGIKLADDNTGDGTTLNKAYKITK